MRLPEDGSLVILVQNLNFHRMPRLPTRSAAISTLNGQIDRISPLAVEANKADELIADAWDGAGVNALQTKLQDILDWEGEKRSEH